MCVGQDRVVNSLDLQNLQSRIYGQFLTHKFPTKAKIGTTSSPHWHDCPIIVHVFQLFKAFSQQIPQSIKEKHK
jgi:hypothetical protein